MVGGEKVHDEAHKDAEGVEEEDRVEGGQDGGEDDFARTQVKAAELRSSMQAGVSLMYSNVTFTRVFLSDKDIMKGFKVGHFVDQLLKSIIGKCLIYPSDMVTSGCIDLRGPSLTYPYLRSTDTVVEQCEQSKQNGGDDADAEEDVDLVENSIRASASVLKRSMEEMGLDPDEQLPLSFGSTAKGCRAKVQREEDDGVQPLVYSAPM